MGSCFTNKGELAKADDQASPMGSKVAEASNPFIKPSKKGEKSKYSSWGCNKERSTRYDPHRYAKVPFYYQQIKSEKKNILYKKPCKFHGLNNHCTTRCWKILSLNKQIQSTKKKGNYFCDKKESNINNFCTHFQTSHHRIGKCWKVHPHIHPNQSKRTLQVSATRKICSTQD